jgi:flagellar hook-associated protein FlgK
MGLLSEIVKSSEALRYHSKSAEVAGQNLAHVNDKDYARQRVLAREGVMHSSNFGGLGTSGLESAGLDHARNVVLDSRVINELGETASLEARKEVLDLLQSALGEKIDREGLTGGLDSSHESDLSAGSLTRALNDFFNAFQELSASPDEPTIKQGLLHAIDTVVRRFNEAGSSLEQIEEDLTVSVQRSIDNVNRILAQIHEVNKQVRRFQLQDKGTAVSYIDRRQALLEELSQIIDFTTEDDIVDGKPSGFVNIFANGADGEKINLLAPQGAKPMTNDWGQEIELASTGVVGASSAKIRAKIDSDGKLGRVEVLKGGSKYDDSKGPMLVSFLPPASTFIEQDDDGAGLGNANDNQAPNANQATDRGGETAGTVGNPESSGNPLTGIKYKEGEVFHRNGDYYQALSPTQVGDSLDDAAKFLKITQPVIGGVIDEKKLRFSDIESFDKGEQVYIDGKVYQAVEDFGPVTSEIGRETEVEGIEQVKTTKTYSQGEVFNYNGTYLQAAKKVLSGSGNLVQFKGDNPTSVPGDLSDDKNFYVIGNSLPTKSNAPVPDANPYFFDGSPMIDLADGSQLRLGAYIDSSVKTFKSGAEDLPIVTNNDDINGISLTSGEIYYYEPEDKHFYVDATTFVPEGGISDFDPTTSSNFHFFKATLAGDGTSKTEIIRSTTPAGYKLGNGGLEELNIGIAEAIISDGEITGFNVINEGNSFPSSDSIFVEGVELKIESGSIHGYQHARNVEMEAFRTSLNELVTNFATQVNQVYNPDDDPKGFIFGFDAFISRPTQGTNKIWEEDYASKGLSSPLYGTEGNAEMEIFRNEVEMTTPYPENDTFTVVSSTPVLPEGFLNSEQYQGLTEEEQKSFLIRGEAHTELQLPDLDYSIYGAARRMQYVTMEEDRLYPGEDRQLGNGDDGRSIMLAYEDIPFKINQGTKAMLLGDNFSFDVIPGNTWNLAKSLNVDRDLTADSLKSSHDFAEGANEVAVAIGEMINGEFTDSVSTMNTQLGNSLEDLNDNLEHQKTVETLLVDQRNAVSSVSIDEEVADLMQFQRSFQASSRVLNTLDKMLELVVMGLIK